MWLTRQEDAGCGDQAGPDGCRHWRHGRADGPSHPCQTGPHRSRQQVRELRFAALNILWNDPSLIIELRGSTQMQRWAHWYIFNAATWIFIDRSSNCGFIIVQFRLIDIDIIIYSKKDVQYYEMYLHLAGTGHYFAISRQIKQRLT